MICYNCGCSLTKHNFCTNCKVEVRKYKLVVSASNLFYNEGLEKARVRDLSGAVGSLCRCLKLNKNHVEARNLLGLIYFEMGESVQAMNEWVISKNLQPEKNVANDYISLIQSNPGKLESMNVTIKKYNQALTHCYQGNLDLALIQLKKVLSMNPKYLQAHLLLALIFIHQEEWTRARKELEKCLRIDISNTTALQYRAKINQILGENEPLRPPNKANLKPSVPKSSSVSEESYQYQSGNEMIIQPYRVTEGKMVASVGNLLVGLCIGIAVAWFLILPARIQNAKAGINEEMKVVSEQLDVKSATINELESKLKLLETDKEKLEGELEGVIGSGGTMEDVDNLLHAVRIFMETPSKTDQISEYLDRISAKSIAADSSESFAALYTALLREVGGTLGEKHYALGMEAYQSGDYELAVQELTRATTYDVRNSEAYFNLANSYRKLGKDKEAIAVYEKVIELFPSTERANRSQSYINEMS